MKKNLKTLARVIKYNHVFTMKIVYFTDKLLINFLTNDAFCSYIYYNSPKSDNNSGYIF